MYLNQEERKAVAQVVGYYRDLVRLLGVLESAGEDRLRPTVDGLADDAIRLFEEQPDDLTARVGIVLIHTEYSRRRNNLLANGTTASAKAMSRAYRHAANRIEKHIAAQMSRAERIHWRQGLADELMEALRALTAMERKAARRGRKAGNSSAQ